ncbi:MerR family transcriptional regulator [Paenibacillus sp. NPDC093718]|uniref:MerR family transcriptional regulator n=1 Tax=Paenibacillus sp. NPDC093718 TaxID=3390601 RepID=UPI003D03B626
MEKLYSIQEVSQLLGISKDTLRYYDRIGIVSPSRENNRYRRYSKNDLIVFDEYPNHAVCGLHS